MERARRSDRVITSGWYAANIGAPCIPIENAVAGGLARTRIGRGLKLYLATRSSSGAAIRRTERGALTALSLAAVFGRARIVVLELIPDRPARPGWRRTLKRMWFAMVERPIVRHGMTAGQTLSASERPEIARLYRLDPGRLEHVPYAFTRTAMAPSPAAVERSGVLSSGRAACDWETLFAAASGSDWPLTVVCGAEHLTRVEELNRDGRARVLNEISRDAHDELMRAAAVFAMPLIEDGLSAGQVRLMTATECGTPVVASRVRTLAGYVVEGETALLVEPGDPPALRAAIESLLTDAPARERLASAALEHGRERTYADYFADVGAMLARVLELGPRPQTEEARVASA